MGVSFQSVRSSWNRASFSQSQVSLHNKSLVSPTARHMTTNDSRIYWS